MTNTKTISKRVLTFILAIVTAMAFMPVTAFTQPVYATIPTLIIGGETFEFPLSDQESTYATTTNGTVSEPQMSDTEPEKWNIRWDGSTLTLKDAEITVASGKAIYSDARCELRLIGENTVIDKDTASAALLWDGPLTITGGVGGYVRINAVGKGISGSTLSISSGTVYSKSTEDNGIYTSGDITITGGIVTGLSTATTGNHSGIKTGGGLSVSGGTVVARSAHYEYSESGCGAETASAPVITGGAVYAEGGNKAFSAVPVGGTGAALSGETIYSSGSKPDQSVVIMTKKDGTTYTPTVTFAEYNSWPAFYSHLWICGFPFSFENGRQAGVTYGAYDSSGSSQWSVTMPTGSSSSDNYLNLNDYTGIGDEEPSGIFDYAPNGYVGLMSINLTGTNKVKTWVNGGAFNACGIRNANDLEFSGNGSLAVNVANVESSSVQGIDAYGKLTLNGDPTVTVHATSGKYDVYGISEADPPVINGGSVTASGATAAWFIMKGITANITCNKSGYVPIATYSADMTGTDSSTIINPTDSTTPTVAALFTKNNGGGISLYKYLKLKLGAVKTVTNTLTNIRTNNSSTSWVQDGTSDYTATLSAAKGYALPDSIEVKIGGTTLAAGANTYTYDSTSGALTIRNAVITGNIEIIGTGNELPPLQVTNTLTNMTTNNSSTSWVLSKTSDYTATLTADSGYALPDSIEVKIGGTTLAAGANTYTYDSTSGDLTIKNAAITGNIEIIGAGTAVPTPTPTPPTYTVEEDTDNGDISYDAAPTYGEDWTCYIDPGDGYTYPDSVTVTIDDKDTSNYTYDKTTGKITVPGQYITGTVKIAGICAKIAKPAAAAKVILLKTINSGRNMKLTWTAVGGATKYVIYGSQCGVDNKYKKLKTVRATTMTYTFKSLKLHKAYKYYVAAYKGSKKLCRSISTHTVVKSKSGLYNAVKITAANKTVSLAVGKASKIKATVKAKSGHRLFGSGHCAKVRYVSKNPLIAKVSSKGKITAVATGKTTVYAIAHDGIRVAIRVSVK